MKVWVVEASDRYYDEGSDWLVGVYSTELLAILAAERDYLDYAVKHGPIALKQVYENYIYERELDA